jgi:hypothetical protein
MEALLNKSILTPDVGPFSSLLYQKLKQLGTENDIFIHCKI